MNYSETLNIQFKTAESSVKIDSEAFAILSQVERFFSERNLEAYLVGGFIRDIMLGRSTADIDIAVEADVLKVAPEMADILGGKYVLLDENNRIARIVFPSRNTSTVNSRWCVDLSSMLGDIHQDLARRDFAIDALAASLSDVVRTPADITVIDPFHGLDDLRNRSVHALNENVFTADPVRLLRAYRLAAELGFSISSETSRLIRRDSQLIRHIAGERIREELLRFLAGPGAGQVIRTLDEAGLLTAIIPELEDSRGVEQPVEHHWDVLNHSLETVRAVDFLLRQGDWEFASPTVLEAVPWSAELERHFSTDVGAGSTHASLLKLAALLHDISKPETRIQVEDRTRFFGHNEQGAAKAVTILERLRFSNKEIKLVEVMVLYHMRPTQMSHEGLPSRRAVYRYLRDTGAAAVDILFLSLADHLAARGPDLDAEQWKWHVEQSAFILTDCSRRQEIVAPPRLIDGHDLINIFGLPPGRLIRDLLEAVREAQASGEIISRQDALSYVKNRLLYIKQKIEG